MGICVRRMNEGPLSPPLIIAIYAKDG